MTQTHTYRSEAEIEAAHAAGELSLREAAQAFEALAKLPGLHVQRYEAGERTREGGQPLATARVQITAMREGKPVGEIHATPKAWRAVLDALMGGDRDADDVLMEVAAFIGDE